MAKPRKLHIVMFPWLAFGHLIPYLEIAKLIAKKGHQISFISTPRNIKRLPKVPQDLAPLINFVTVALPHEDNLPPNAEATMDVPYHLIPYLKMASDGLQESVTQFLESSSPDWIIYDFFPYWLPPIAAKLGISRAFFSIFNAWTLSFFGSSIPDITGVDDPRTETEHFTVPPKWVPFPTNVSFRQYEARQIFSLTAENVSGVSDKFRLSSVVSGSEVFFIRSCMELEPEWLNLLGALHLKPVVPVGLIPPSLQHVGGEDDKDETWQNIVEWLDKQKKGTVVYIALGSEVTPSQQDFTELAHGLELSGLPFFWVLRKRHNSVGNGSVELPDGFEEKVKGRGVVWTSWAPQLKILSHDSVGGFLTHCGWSSIIEGIYFERPLIMLPFIGDQGLNARVFQEKKVGIEIPRNEQDGSFTRNSVAGSLSLVMSNEGGKIYREKAKEMSKIFEDQELHHKYIDKFVDYLQNYRQMC